MVGGSLAEGLSFGSTMPAGQHGGDSRPRRDRLPDDVPCIHNEAHCLAVPRWAPSRMTTRCAVVQGTKPLTCQALVSLAMFLYILRFLVPHLVLLQVRKTSCVFQRQQRQRIVDVYCLVQIRLHTDPVSVPQESRYRHPV